MALVVDKLIPEFEAEATGGIKVSNTTHLDQMLVLFFYPKDNTPGCTTEALQFRDKYELIADTEEKMCHMFGVVKNKIMYGKKVKGISRSTFLVGPDGVLRKEWRGVKVENHVAEVLKAVKALKKAGTAVSNAK